MDDGTTAFESKGSFQDKTNVHLPMRSWCFAIEETVHNVTENVEPLLHRANDRLLISFLASSANRNTNC